MKRALLIGRLILGAVFVYAAWTKLRAPWLQFAVSINSYQVVPLGWLEAISRTLPWVELALGLLLIAGFGLAWVATAGALLLGFFFALMVRSFAVGLQIDCGCFGPGEALGPKTLLRDGSLVALAAAIAAGAFRAKALRRKPADASQPHEPASVN